jgi:hypothetical protein
MAETTYFPRRLILAGAMISGVLLALAVHMLGARYGLDLGGLWRSNTRDFMPAGAAVAWWLIATVGFSGGYFTATLMDSGVGANSAADATVPDRGRRPRAGGRGPGGLCAQSDPDHIGGACRSRRAGPRGRDGFLRRALCVTQGLSR